MFSRGHAMGLKLVTAPVLLPVSLATLKEHCRVSHNDEDTILTAYLKAAVEQVERWTWRSLLTQTLRMTLDRFPCGREPIYLPRPVCQSVTSIEYLDENGDEQELADYTLATDSEPARIAPDTDCSWPATDRSLGNVRITYVAGWDAANKVPQSLAAAVLLAAASLYEHREDRDAREETAVMDLCNLHAIRDDRVCMAFD